MSLSGITFSVIVSCVWINAIVYTQSCTLDVKDLPTLAPVFITNQKELAKNVGRFLKWQVGEKGEILCNGRENGLSSEAEGKKRAVIECRADGLYVNEKKGLENISCLKENTADVIITSETCTHGGVLKYIGFRSRDKSIVKYIKVCYSDKQVSPIYTYHTIWGKGSRFMHNFPRPIFSMPGVPHVNLRDAYAEQKETLRELLGKNARFYIKEESVTFSKGHLTPSRDGLFKSWQLATYYYINTAPQFAAVNGNNWETVEILVRNKAANLKDEIEVYTGVSGVLALPNGKNRLSPIYLQKKYGKGVVSVPKWFWKIAKFKDRGIAFVTLNNPHITAIRPVCENICKKYGWDDKYFSVFKYGYTICCSVESLMKAFSEVPEEAKVSHPLKY